MDSLVRIKVSRAVLLLVFAIGSLKAASPSWLSNQSVVLQWSTPAQSAIAGYKVYYGPADQFYTTVVDVGSNTLAQIAHLVAGQAYTFAVTAYNSFGLESPFSGQLSYLVPFPPGGNYVGLFSEAVQPQVDSSGSITLQVEQSGVYSGKLQLGGGNYSFSGKLGSKSQLSSVISRGQSSALSLQLNVHANQLSGQVSDGQWAAELEGRPTAWNARSAPAPYAGKYTLVLPGQQNSSGPVGSGYGWVQVNANGLARFAGVLADGTRVSQNASLSSDGRWPLYASLGSGKGAVIGWLTFSNQPASDLSGALSWLKGADNSARYYPQGFAYQTVAVGSAYAPPLPANGVLDWGNGQIVCSGGDLGSGFADSLVISKGAAIGPWASVRFSMSNGTFSGRAADPITRQSYIVNGTILQKVNAGYGFLLGPTQSSSVILHPDNSSTPPPRDARN